MNPNRIKELNVRFLPSSIDEHAVVGRCVVMADILRASSTIINALANGCKSIHPQAEIESAKRLASSLGGKTLLGGERNGKIVDGFDSGNSPLEYDADRVAEIKLVLCTTNGTYTLEKCKAAEKVVIGAFLNLESVCAELRRHESGLIACAGTDRIVTDEDILFAGAVTQRLVSHQPDLRLDDAAKIALSRWQLVEKEIHDRGELWEILAQSHGGRNLMRLGYQHDIQFCAQVDTHDLVPELDLASWTIKQSIRQPVQA